METNNITPIKVFLDSVDAVLNSNTFLLQFDLHDKDINTELSQFIKSKSFIQQLASQDKERGWFLLHHFDMETKKYKLRQGTILEDKIELKIKELKHKKNEYLAAMLTGDTAKGRFYSFYSKQIDGEKANAIVENFISAIVDNDDWKLYIAEPNFLKVAVEVYSNKNDLGYFDGDDGNDSASIILTNKKDIYY